ncbi:hypothetical protein Tco_1193359 [Tanacetum coccineum]
MPVPHRSNEDQLRGFDDSFVVEPSTSSCHVMGRVKDINSIPNLRILLAKEGFEHVKLSYLGGLWVLIELDNEGSKQKFLDHVGVNSWFWARLGYRDNFLAPLLLVKTLCILTKQPESILEKFKHGAKILNDGAHNSDVESDDEVMLDGVSRQISVKMWMNEYGPTNGRRHGEYPRGGGCLGLWTIHKEVQLIPLMENQFFLFSHKDMNSILAPQGIRIFLNEYSFSNIQVLAQDEKGVVKELKVLWNGEAIIMGDCNEVRLLDVKLVVDELLGRIEDEIRSVWNSEKNKSPGPDVIRDCGGYKIRATSVLFRFHLHRDVRDGAERPQDVLSSNYELFGCPQIVFHKDSGTVICRKDGEFKVKVNQKDFIDDNCVSPSSECLKRRG